MQVLLPDGDGKAASRPAGSATPHPARRVDLDRLRLLACLSTFCYHAIQVFDLNPYYHLKSVTLSPTLDVAARLLHAVRMPLFFLIAGIVGFMAMNRRSNWQLMSSRAGRLLPPFLIGVVLLTPGIKYFELLDGRFISWSGYSSWDGTIPDPLHFLRRYFTQLRWFSWSHMWFLLYLLVLSSMLLPVLRWMARADTTLRMPATLALALPLAAFVAVEMLLRPLIPHHIPNLFRDWASVAVYAIVLLWGGALVQWPVLVQALQRSIPTILALMALGFALYLGVDAWSVHYRPVHGIGRALTLWSVLCLAIAIGPWLAHGHIPGERYLSEAALSLYVLHHLPLIAIAYHVKDLPWPVWQRYGVIVLGSFAVTVALYHVLVRPFNVARLAFGLPPRGT